jgi:hypothetical protein
MKCAALVVALLVTLATACGSNSRTPVSGIVPPSIPGSWSVELTQNGTTQSLFQTTLVSEAVVSGACNLPTQDGTISAQVLDLTGCYIADSMTDQGSFTCAGSTPPVQSSCIMMPVAMLVMTRQNSVDISIVLVETDPAGAFFQFNGNGAAAANGTITGNWTCGTLSTCMGWSGTFSGTPN